LEADRRTGVEGAADQIVGITAFQAEQTQRLGPIEHVVDAHVEVEQAQHACFCHRAWMKKGPGAGPPGPILSFAST
jgi:hypothetical protein